MAAQNEFPSQSSGHLLHNVVLFGRLLRWLGIDVNPSRMVALVRALDHIDIGNRPEFYYTCLCLLVQNKEEIPLFEHAFNLFWGSRAQNWSTLDLAKFGKKESPSYLSHRTIPPSLSQENPSENQKTDSADQANTQVMVLQTYSDLEVLRQKDFGELTSDELVAIKELMAQLVWQLGKRRSRRRRPGGNLSIDLRQSLRNNFRYGGEFIKWSYRKHKYTQRPLIVIADISGSMEQYTRLLLHFLYSLTRGLDQSVETFVFSTRLTRISQQLHDQDVDEAMNGIADAVPDWSGGTRIGQALKKFNFTWARRVLGRGAVVLLISDGWDRGDPQLLSQEIARLQRSCHRLIWLNPLLGSPDYEPLTRGMVAALPYIDDFLPVHNLASLEDLTHYLKKLDFRRSQRRQQIGMSAMP